MATKRIELAISLLRTERLSLVDRLSCCPVWEREYLGDAIAWVDRDLDALYAKADTNLAIPFGVYIPS